MPFGCGLRHITGNRVDAQGTSTRTQFVMRTGSGPSPDYSCLSEVLSVKDLFSSATRANSLGDPFESAAATASPVQGMSVAVSKRGGCRVLSVHHRLFSRFSSETDE